MRTLYRNGRVHSPAIPGATALLVEDGLISWIGRENGVIEPVATTVVDVHNALITPAFTDAHVHATGTGIALSGLDLSDANSLTEALDRVERATRSGRGRAVLGGGWDEAGWPERRAPTSAELDRAGYGGAVYLARVDAHSAVVSSALAAAVPGLPGLAGYRRDGWLTRAAHDAARTAAFAALTAGQTRELQRTALRRAASLGIACVHEMAGPAISSAADLGGLLELAGSEALPEVIGYWGELNGVATARELGAAGAAGDLFCDGSLGSHTAALHQPYTDAPDTSGALRYDLGELVEHVVACTVAGVQAGFHVIGDAAVDQALDAFELAAERVGRPAGAAHRLEHVEYVHDPARLARAGVVASMQPMFDASWGGPDGMYASRLGVERAERLNRFAELAAAGVPLAFGSDAPVTALGPWAAVRAAVHPSWPGGGIDVATAFDAHTAAGWRAAGRPGEGVLVPGAPATFAVWDGAPGPGLPALAPGEPLPTCRATVRAGTAIFDAASG